MSLKHSQKIIKKKFGYNSRFYKDFYFTNKILKKDSLKNETFISDNITKLFFQTMKRNIKFLIKINCYKGLRHKKNLPVRGQRTQTNAKTCKKIKYK